MLVFSDAELGLLGKAFDRAWDKYLRAGVLTPDNLFESRQLLAGRILRSAYFGERDPFHLARDAVSYLWQVKNFEGVRKRVQNYTTRSTETMGHVAFDVSVE